MIPHPDWVIKISIGADGLQAVVQSSDTFPFEARSAALLLLECLPFPGKRACQEWIRGAEYRDALRSRCGGEVHYAANCPPFANFDVMAYYMMFFDMREDFSIYGGLSWRTVCSRMNAFRKEPLLQDIPA